MSTQCCCSAGFDIFTDLVVYEGVIHSRLGEFYQENPIMARVIATPIALIAGFVKVILFPVICVIGVVVLPILACVRAIRKEVGAGDLMKAWVFCLLGLAISAAFLIIAVHHLSLVASGALLITAISISIVVHVYKLVKEPPPPPEIPLSA
jgi:hypothetical protein